MKEKNEEKKKIEKPTILKIQEFRERLANDINQSKLDFYILIPILEDFLNQLRQLNAQLYESEKQSYEEQLKELEVEDGNSKTE